MSPPGPTTVSAARPTGRRTATDRVLRMLSIVPWIAAHDGPRIDEVCERFGIARGQLLDDLNVVQFVGLPPYTPDTLIEVVFDDDRVWVRFADVFSRPLRLTPSQALGLVAAGAALSTPPDGGVGGSDQHRALRRDRDREVAGPLARGLAKLADLLGIAPDEAVTIRLGSSRPEVLETLRQALRQQRRVHLDYFAYSRDERTQRDVDPYRVFAADGAWYLFGHCHLAGGQRLFRIDRIYGVDLLDESFERPPVTVEGDPSVFDADPAAPRVTLDLAPSARWVAETYPVEESAERERGGLRVRLAVASRPWFERLLLRLGPDAQVVEATDPDLRHCGRDAARRVLARYRVGTGDAGRTRSEGGAGDEGGEGDEGDRDQLGARR